MNAVAGQRRAAEAIELPLPNGLRLCLESADMQSAARYVIAEVFEERQYERAGFEIGASDTVVDVGANIGVFSLWAARQASGGRVLSIEPLPQLAACLSASMRANGIDNIDLDATALAADEGDMELIYYPGFNIISHRSDFRRPLYARIKMYLKNLRNWGRPHRVAVPTASLATVLDRHGIDRVDFLKVDCEGGEYELAESMNEADWQRIDRLVIEFHEYHRSHDHRRLVSILEESGFDVTVVRDPVTFGLMRFGTLWAKRR